MPIQRPPTAEEAEELKQQGIDPSTALVTEAGAEDTKQEDKPSITGTVGKTAVAHAGGWIGGGAGMAGATALGAALAPETFGASMLIPAIVGAGGAMAGSYLGQKGQELALGDKQKQLEQDAAEASQAHPYVAAGTDIVGSALAGGGKFNLSNLREAGSQLIGRNALNEIDSKALADLGESALGSRGTENLAAQAGGKEAIGKLIGSAVLNPAINTGLDLATGHTPTIGELSSQVAGGLLFSEPSALGRWMHGTGTHEDEPVPEVNAKIPDTVDSVVEQKAPIVINRDAAGNPIDAPVVPKATTSDVLGDNPINKPTVPSSEEPNVTEDNKNDGDLEAQLLKAQDDREQSNDKETTTNQDAKTTAIQSAFDKAKLDYQREVAYDPTSDKAQEMLQNLQATQQRMEDHAKALQEIHEQTVNENPAPLGTEKPLDANALRIIDPKTLLPQLAESKVNNEEGSVPFKPKVLPQGDDTPPTKEEQVQDDWDTRLAKLKVKDEGQMYGGLSGISVTAWNGSIDAIRLGLRAGKAIHEAIKDGIAYIRANHPSVKIDEGEYTKEVGSKMQDVYEGNNVTKDVVTKTNTIGPLGKLTEPLYDKIARINHPVARAIAGAFKAVDNTRDQYVGDSWNKIKSVMDRVGFTKGDGVALDRVSDWENKNGQAAPLSMFRNRAQRAVYNIERQVYDETGKRRIANNEPVYRDGNPTKLKQDPYAHPTPLAPKVAEVYKNGTDKKAIAKYDKDFIDNALRYGKTQGEAKGMLKEMKSAMQGQLNDGSGNMSFFGGARLAQGTPLPKTWTVDNYANRLESYHKRQALDNAFYKHVESNPQVMSALGATKDAWRNSLPKDLTGVVAGNPDVRNALDQFQGSANNPTSHGEGAITNLASTLFVSSPVIEMHKILSNTINGALSLADNPVEAIKTAGAMIKGFSDGIQHARENGVLKMTARSVGNFFDANATFAEKIQALSQGYRNLSSLGGRTDAWNMGLMQSGFEYSLNNKIEKASNGDTTSQQFLKKLDPSYTVGKTYNTKEVQQLASVASSYVHGTKDGRTMPSWMLKDTELSGFFKLAHWSISQTNRFMSDVYTPATKGNIKPMVNALLGSAIGGYVIRELREKLQGKHGDIPDLKEIQASEGGLQGNKNLIAYNIISAMQYAGFAGILSQAVKYPFDRIMKNKPQGAVFPLDEIASDLSTQIGNLTSAAANDPKFEWGAATIALMNHIMSTDIQLSRIAVNQGVNNGLITGNIADKKMLSDKLGQLRRFDMVSGLPYDDQEPSQANPYMNIEQKKFKMQQDLPKAMGMLPGLVNNIISTYKETPDVMLSKLKALKQNVYETFPSIEDKAPSFSKYMTYIEKLKGSGSSDKEYEDYLHHKIINEVKASAVP